MRGALIKQPGLPQDIWPIERRKRERTQDLPASQAAPQAPTCPVSRTSRHNFNGKLRLNEHVLSEPMLRTRSHHISKQANHKSLRRCVSLFLAFPGFALGSGGGSSEQSASAFCCSVQAVICRKIATKGRATWWHEISRFLSSQAAERCKPFTSIPMLLHDG